MDEALSALRVEYPTLLASPALEEIDGQGAVGHDVEFVSLDMNNACALRAFRTRRRTIFVLTQWSDLEGEEAEGRAENPPGLDRGDRRLSRPDRD